ncbi:ABC transporter permease subunit [Natrinema salaciae]|uniref:ABC-2 type transport system permease protein n=1 Tax=Natrinema salaciae TaxID=1186196 RepID=A0A1H9FU79_9EURY|nr:ABC transporter permease subunit [Natrinema salaciae]SEQ41048.1 ABC-2 type transport system permease protein [Natrinema salaciae]
MTKMGTIARKDISDASRSRLLWGAVSLMVLVLVLAWNDSGALLERAENNPILYAINPFGMFVPFVAIVLGYKSIVGERTSGRIRILLGLPGRRRDVVFGKYLGRMVVFLVIMSVTVVTLIALSFVRLENVNPYELVGAAALLFLYGFAWTGMTVGISSSVSSETRAVAAIVGLFVLFLALWEATVLPIFALLFTGSASTQGLDHIVTADGPTWYLYATRLNPVHVFDGSRYNMAELVENAANGTVASVHGPDLFGFAMLLAWAIIPIAIGYWRFERAELS